MAKLGDITGGFTKLPAGIYSVRVNEVEPTEDTTNGHPQIRFKGEVIGANNDALVGKTVNWWRIVGENNLWVLRDELLACGLGEDFEVPDGNSSDEWARAMRILVGKRVEIEVTIQLFDKQIRKTVKVANANTEERPQIAVVGMAGSAALDNGAASAYSNI